MGAIFCSLPLLPLEWNTRVFKNGRFSVSVVAAADASVLAAGSLIYCEMRIPGTGYVKRKAILYYPAGKKRKVLKNDVKISFLFLRLSQKWR